MKVEFAPTFFKSLKKIIMHETWWYKTYDFFKRDLWRFFGNIWYFRKELYNHRPWDSTYSMSLLRRSLEQLCDTIEKYGHEVDEGRLPKIEKMKRAIQLIKYHENDEFTKLAEKELGYEYTFGKWEFEEVDEKDLDPEITKGQKYYKLKDDKDEEETDRNQNIFKLSMKIEKDTWNELMEILKGQDTELFDKDVDWYKQQDGSGLKMWWD
jgi:hypothetical protein